MHSHIYIKLQLYPYVMLNTLIVKRRGVWGGTSTFSLDDQRQFKCRKKQNNLRNKANPSPPWNLPTSIGHMPGLWGGKVGCLMSHPDIIQTKP